jgi:hypothetical protein
MYVFSKSTARRIEDAIEYRYADEVADAPTWQWRVMGVEKPTGDTQTLQFREPTVKIYQLGPQGAGMFFDPSIHKEMKYQAGPVGNGKELYRRQMSVREKAGIREAGDWASEAGKVANYYPVRGMMSLLFSGLGAYPQVLSFDEQPLFSKVHPIGGASDATYANEHNGMDFTPLNLAAGWTYVAGLIHGGDAPRYLAKDGLIVMLPQNKYLRGQQTLNAESYTDVFNVQAAAANTIKNAFGFQPPIIEPEFNPFPDVWFLGVPIGKTALDSGLVLVEDEPFAINSFSHLDDITLAEKQVLAYHQRAWIGFAAGKPYMIHRFNKAGALDPWMAAILASQ